MIQVLIVDDEPLVRSYIRSLIDWESYGFTVCGEACDGREAMTKIELLHPNIVILDVYMPDIDGLALSQLIKENYKEIKMIVLSSYDKYDYVRETLKNGAVDYVLKHRIDEPTLLSILNKTMLQIIEEEKKASREKLLESELIAANSALIESNLKILITENERLYDQTYNYFNNVKLYNENTSLVLFAIQIRDYDIMMKRYSEREKNEIINKITVIFRQVIGDFTKGYVFYFDGGRFSVMLAYEESKSESSFHEKIQDFKRRVESSLRMLFNLDSIIGTSPIFNRISDISKSYRSACSEIEVNSKDCDNKAVKELNEVQSFNNGKKYSRYVKDAVSFINEHYMEDISLDTVARSIGVSAAYLSRLFSEEYGCTLTDYLKKTRIEISKKMLGEKDIRVNEVYDAVGFKNYSYFFKVFKEYTGMTPLEYINKR